MAILQNPLLQNFPLYSNTNDGTVSHPSHLPRFVLPPNFRLFF